MVIVVESDIPIGPFHVISWPKVLQRTITAPQLPWLPVCLANIRNLLLPDIYSKQNATHYPSAKDRPCHGFVFILLQWKLVLCFWKNRLSDFIVPCMNNY